MKIKLCKHGDAVLSRLEYTAMSGIPGRRYLKTHTLVGWWCFACRRWIKKDKGLWVSQRGLDVDSLPLRYDPIAKAVRDARRERRAVHLDQLPL